MTLADDEPVLLEISDSLHVHAGLGYEFPNASSSSAGPLPRGGARAAMTSSQRLVRLPPPRRRLGPVMLGRGRSRFRPRAARLALGRLAGAVSLPLIGPM